MLYDLGSGLELLVKSGRLLVRKREDGKTTKIYPIYWEFEINEMKAKYQDGEIRVETEKGSYKIYPGED